MAKTKTPAPASPREDAGSESDSDSSGSSEGFKVLQHVGTFEGRRKATVTVDVLQYKDHTPHIYTRRSGVDKKGAPWTGKLGGVDADEARKLAPLLVKAAEALSALTKG